MSLNVEFFFSGVVTSSSLEAPCDTKTGLCKTPNLLALGSMSTPNEVSAAKDYQLGALMAIAAAGFLAGQVLGAVFEALSASIAHFSGGVAALAKSSSPPWWANASGLLGLWIGFGAAVYLAYRPQGLRQLPDQWRLRWSDAQYVVLGVAAQLLIDAAYKLFDVRSLNGPVHHLFGAAVGPSFVLIAFMTTIGAPLMEEWFFRGVVFRALSERSNIQSRLVRLIISCGLSGALFAAAHGELKQFAGLFALGVLLAFLVERTKRLTPSVITHVSFNAVALVGVLLQRSGH